LQFAAGKPKGSNREKARSFSLFSMPNPPSEMSMDADQGSANATAEQVLRLIFGDDFTGCPVRLEAVAEIVSRGWQRAALEDEMRRLYEAAIEALHAFSTPPAHGSHLAPEAMPALLSERLDSIHNLTQRLIETSIALKARIPSDQETP
jgi:hypothetical protein